MLQAKSIGKKVHAFELSKESGQIIEKRQSHDENQHGQTDFLQNPLPSNGNRFAGQRLPKILHQVPPIQHGQGEEIKKPQTDTDQAQKSQIGGQSPLGRLPSLFRNGQRAAQVLGRSLAR